MCGICGIIHPNSLDPTTFQNVVKNMNDAIIHRGPDADGFFNNQHCSLAMRRLSIIDLNGGRQPLYNEDQSILAFLNGEIYNYRELKKDLVAKNHKFYSSSDTEIIPHLFEKYGTGSFKMLKGMFVLCIYDVINNKWIFARDRFGEKPFFYHHKKNHFSYSSEIKSLLKDKSIERKLNDEVLSYYLTNTFIPEPETLLKDVYSLPPGNFLELDENGIVVQPYFEIDYSTDYSIKTEEECVEYIEPILKKAVQRQMISDVPIGAFLSGGIDSSTVVALMQEHSDIPVKTFNVKFEDAAYDESPIAREVAKKLNTEHHELLIKNQTFTKEIFWKIIEHVGFPFHDTSAIPTFFITKEIKKHVTVALSGDGGDEIFAGYPFYQWWNKVHSLKYLPKFLTNSLSSVLGNISGLNQIQKIRQLTRALDANQGDSSEIGARMSILFDPEELKSLNYNYSVGFEKLSRFPIRSKNWTLLQKGLYYKLKQDLPLDMLIKVDRMSMANSLEVRAPFLDPDLFDAATKIPDKFLIKGGNGKSIIRKVMKDKLPASVFNHPKSGFSIPMHKFMNDSFVDLCQELIIENSKMKSLFDLSQLKNIVQRGLTQKKDEKITVYRATHQLWSMLQLGGWLNLYEIEIE